MRILSACVLLGALLCLAWSTSYAVPDGLPGQVDSELESRQGDANLTDSEVVSFEIITGSQMIRIGAFLCLLLVTIYFAFTLANRSRNNPLAFQFASNAFKQVSVLVIALIVALALLLSWWALDRIDLRLRSEVRDSLQTVNDTINEALTIWSKDHEENLNVIARDDRVVASVENLLRAADSGVGLLQTKGLKDLRTLFSEWQESELHIGFFVIDPNGISLASMRDSNMGRANLIKTRRPDLFKRVLAGETLLVPPIPSDVPISDLANIKGLGTPPSMFFVAPIRNSRGQVIAAISERLDPHGAFNHILQLGRMGQTGESYAFDERGNMLTESRFIQHWYDENLLAENEQGILSIQIRDPGGPLPNSLDSRRSGFTVTDERSPLTLMAERAIQRETGNNVTGYRDYRGIDVFGAWRWNDKLGLGLATEIDKSEALQTYYIARFTILVIIAITVSVSIALILFSLMIGSRANRYLRRAQNELEERVDSRTKDLQESEQQIQSVVDHVPAAIYLKDNDGKYVLVNEMFEEITGFEREQILGKTDTELFPPAVEGITTQAKLKVLSQDTRYQLEERVPHPDGTVHDYWSIKSPMTLKPSGVSGLLAVSIDITDRKRIEDEFKTQEKELNNTIQLLQGIMESTNYSIIATDKEGLIQVFNHAAEDMLQYRAVEMVGRQTPAILHDKNEVLIMSQLLSQELNQNIEPGFEVFVAKARRGFSDEKEWTYIRKDGSQFPVSLSVTALRDKAKNITGFLGIAIDITERRRMEADLVEVKEQAEIASLAKSEFLASMSHEIRTPMNGVLGMLGLVQYSQLDEQQRKKITVAQQSAQSLLAIINDILDFSKVEAGKLVLEDINFDIRSVLEETVQAMAYRAEEGGLELLLDVHEVTAGVVVGDPGRLRQIITNLLSNAIKFTDQGEVLIRASTRFYDDGHIQLSCTVKDTGIGIPEEKVEYLFDSFTQLDASTTRQFGGTGLGLAICKKLTQLMGGDIKIASKEGAGSSFKFNVLFGKKSGEVATQPSLNIAGLRVLVVDDNETNREILLSQLQRWNIKVVEADSAKAALKTCEEYYDKGGHFDIAILDMHMPEVNGETLAKELRCQSRFDDIKLLMLTSVTDKDNLDQLSQMGFSAYLSKPVGSSDLFNALCVIAESGDAMDKASPVVTQSFLTSLQAQDDPCWQQDTRILLVEDNQINQLVAKELIQSIGLPCDIAGNGLEALASLKVAQDDLAYSLVFMDCQMPELDGYSATERIREGAAGESCRRLPIIAMTAHAMEGDKEKCIDAGMDDYLTKPIDRDRLISMLVKWLPQKLIGADKHDGKPESDSAKQEHRIVQNKTTWLREEALARVVGNVDIFQRLLNMFLSDTPVQLSNLAQALANKKYKELASVAHSIKGAAANLGGKELQHYAAKLEKLAKAILNDDDNGENVELGQLAQAVIDTQLSYDELAAELNKYLKNETHALPAKALTREQLIEKLSEFEPLLQSGSLIESDAIDSLSGGGESGGISKLVFELQRYLRAFDNVNGLAVIELLRAELAENDGE